MIVIGLTGSIGMGKTTVGRMFVEEGAPVFDSDAAVHALYAPGGAAVAAVEAAFPGVMSGGAIDRAKLSAVVLDDTGALSRLESIVHPLVKAAQARFFESNSDAPIVVLDIPLLFETGRENDVHKIVVVSAPAEMQRARAMARPDMSEAKLAAILARQTPDAEKRSKADFVINTGGPLAETRTQVRAILDALREPA